jgi:hypothetical protein
MASQGSPGRGPAISRPQGQLGLRSCAALKKKAGFLMEHPSKVLGRESTWDGAESLRKNFQSERRL